MKVLERTGKLDRINKLEIMSFLIQRGQCQSGWMLQSAGHVTVMTTVHSTANDSLL